jgi:hypothetical protein
MQSLIRILIITLTGFTGYSQSQQPRLPKKVSHAEPVSFDLIRDLGARQGEKEWNVGLGMTSHGSYTAQSYFVEYEFAPIHRLGLEIELPFQFTHGPANLETNNGLEGIKTAAQYSFFVSEKSNTTLAVGYIFEFSPEIKPTLSLKETNHFPFFIAAKKIQQINFLLFTGPSFTFESDNHYSTWLVNTNLHYVLPGTKNFVGVELNGERLHHRNHLMIHPQLKMVVSKTHALGIAIGVPASNSNKKMDFMIRWIYEPAKKTSGR